MSLEDEDGNFYAAAKDSNRQSLGADVGPIADGAIRAVAPDVARKCGR